jgi:hypothetical protein
MYSIGRIPLKTRRRMFMFQIPVGHWLKTPLKLRENTLIGTKIALTHSRGGIKGPELEKTHLVQ